MRLSLVAAMAHGRVIGREGSLPWTLPEDLKNFRRLTLGRVLVMGRRTFESLGRPLPERRNLVLSRQPGYHPPGVEVVGSLEEALARARAVGAGELMVIGGGSLYAQALPRAHRQYLTLIHEAFPGDVLYPPLEPGAWRPVHHEFHPRRPPGSPHAWSYLILDRLEEPMSKVLPPGVPEEARTRLVELMEEPPIPAAELAEQIGAYLGRIRQVVMQGAPLDVSAAERLATLSRDLIGQMGSLPDEADRRLVQAAVRYFVLEDDAEGDLVSILGLDDDEQVLRAVSRHLGN